MNNSNGMYQVGYCYYLGIGVEIDKHKAFTYYLKSAEAGNSMEIWKTVWCYYYGIGVEKNNATRWTSGNKNIDDCMKTFQLRTLNYKDVIEWIPFDRLSGIKKIGKGGFGSVYSATWLNGIRKVETIKDGDNDIYKKAHEPSSIVALKTLAGSKKNNNDFLKEFKSLIACKINFTKLAIYGITQNTETKEYLMVFQYANDGSLYKYLRKNFCNLTWQAKLEIFKNISLELRKKTDEKVLEGDIYGVMPYVAPEVLLGEQQFTQAADIYGLGVIMTEITTGQRPFDGRKFDAKLGADICGKGLRPEFAPGTPKCYIEFANECMNSGSQRRPSTFDVYYTINSWLNKIANSDNNSDDNEIKKQFLEANKVTKSLPISKHPDEIYTSKIISTKSISKVIKNLSQADSVQMDLDITKKT
ncbi:kinase-like domain-containing protein [Gigaspora rosea]|uniref:Kinase-like domain-containing protein n=1 Tax=Gigaspora rosea TaxID=44941 RepID=A0A397UB83_9GLOM|nr:kinase-like domain-containing protein [Gigaspora rosea]